MTDTKELVAELVRVEVEREGGESPVSLELRPGPKLLDELRRRLDLDSSIHLFMRDSDEPLENVDEKRRNLKLIAHRRKAIEIVVRYEHREEKRKFTPSATVLKVLQWATRPNVFGIDPAIVPKANLIVPGAENPLPRDQLVGTIPSEDCDRLVLDLTFRDFTNG